MQESGSPVLAFHLLVAGSATKSLDIGTFESGAHMGVISIIPAQSGKARESPGV